MKLRRVGLLGAVALGGCGLESGVGGVGGAEEAPRRAIGVSPLVLDPGTLVKGAKATGEVTVDNRGDTLVDLEASVLGDPDFSVVLPEGVLGPGESVRLEVVFSPTEPGARIATLRVVDPLGGPGKEVQLTGAGASPSLEADGVHLGPAIAGCSTASGEVLLANTGGHDLTVSDLALVGASPWFSLDPIGLPLVIAPGRSATVAVRFSPVLAGPDATSLRVVSNDPEAAEVDLAVSGNAIWPGEEHEASFVAEARQVSVLIAMDRSASMNPELPVLQVAFEHLIDEISTVLVDWRLGVVTGVSSCVNEGVLGPDSPDLHATFVDAMLGEGSSLTEALLGLAADAVEAPCNADLLLPDQPLQVIVVSDEPEQSGDPQAQVDRVEAVVGDPWLVHISGVLDVYGTCGEGADGYLEAISDTNGVLLDVCAADLADHILDLLVPPARGVDTFAIDSLPVIASIEVEVDGAPWPFLYDAVDQAVRLEPAPEPGAVVVVRWHTDGC